MPIATLISVTSDDPEEIDFLIYLRDAESQVLVDELILKAENLGLSVNAIYLTWEEWQYRATYTDDWDMTYGGTLLTTNQDNIFNLAYWITGLEYYFIKHDDAKFSTAVWSLWGWLMEAQVTPPEEMGDLISDMIDKFHDAEERLWEKQLIFTFAQWLNPYYACNDVLVPNCKAGRVFANEELRLAYSSIIDHSLFVDYHSARLPFTVYDTYHLYEWSSFHNIELPNYSPA